MSDDSAKRSALPERIVSGGQTGVDRAALDVAMGIGIPHGGWCPRGRLAEDGRIPDRYLLEETEAADYPTRTEKNVVDSDGTLILCRGEPTGGTDFTRRVAERRRKPLWIVDLDVLGDPDAIRRWIREQGIAVLNVAGPRESQSPGIGEAAYQFLRRLFESD